MFCIFSGKKQGYVYEAGDDGKVLSTSVVTKKGHHMPSRLGQTSKAITMTC